MERDEAALILGRLAAGFHRETMEAETVELWLEVIDPFDFEVAWGVADRWVKTMDSFPTINQFRHACRSMVKTAEEPRVPVDRWGMPTDGKPPWVIRWQKAREAVPVDRFGNYLCDKGDMRVFPEQIVDGPKYHDDPRYTLAEADEFGIMPEDAWA